MTVPEVVRHELAAARAAGVPFAVAWPPALEAVPATAPGRGAWIVAFAATADEWEAAYVGRPSSTLRWAGVLAEAAAELSTV